MRRLLVVLTVLGTASAPLAGPRASALTGRVTDEDDGHPLAGVTIVVRSDQLAEPRYMLTDEAGDWIIDGLPGGTYSIEYDISGYKLSDHGIRLRPGATRHLLQLLGEPHYTPGSCEVIFPIPTTLPAVVGTGSWRAVTAALARGERPAPADVRIEELLNDFSYALAPPHGPRTMAITTEVGPTPWNDATKLVRVVLHTSPRVGASSPGPAARDVMLEVEENPERVADYRLLGYETSETAGSGLASPGADLGPGHTLTALYEVTPTAHARDATSDRLFTVKARFSTPDRHPRLLRHVVSDRDVRVEDTTVDFHFAAALAGLGMLVRGTPDRADLDWNIVAYLAKHGIGADLTGQRRPLLAVIQRARWVAP